MKDKSSINRNKSNTSHTEVKQNKSKSTEARPECDKIIASQAEVLHKLENASA